MRSKLLAKLWWRFLWRSTLLTWALQGMLSLIVSDEFASNNAQATKVIMLIVSIVASYISFMIALRGITISATFSLDRREV
jgi:ABC-type multidrug transport system permease subunit